MSNLDLIREQSKRPPIIKVDAKVLLQNALILIDHADYDLAVRILKQATEKSPQLMDAYSWLGYCYKQKGEYNESLRNYLKSAELNPCESAFFNLAEIYYLRGDDARASNYYLKTLSEIDYESPYLFSIYKNLGNIAVKQKDYESAQEYYDKAFTVNGHSDDLFVNYGTLEIQKQNSSLALDRFRQALELNLFNEKAWVGLALIYRQMGDFSLSWGDLQRALDINPYNEVALRIAVDWALQDMNYEIAKNAIHTFIKKFPQETEWLYTYAGLLFQLGLWSDSFQAVHKVLDQKPNHKASFDLIRVLNMKLEN